MKKTMLSKIYLMFWMAGLMFILTTAAASAWDAATHAYIEEHLNKKIGQSDPVIIRNRIYGATAIDIFNNDFTSPYLDFANVFHSTSQESFLKAWQIASSKEEKAFAYGFVSHNNKWGMDSTAHISGKTYGKGTGYVIAKAQVLASLLGPDLKAALGDIPDNVLVDLCHYLIESGVDFLVREKDPAIGAKLYEAAASRSDAALALLVDAYKTDFADLAGVTEAEAEVIIAIAEGNFRQSMINYGYALTQEDAIDLVSEGLADVGLGYLGLPPQYKELLTNVARQGILAAMALCRPDFERELKADTGWVNGKLSSAGVGW